MATHHAQSVSDLSATILNGSDELFEKYCEPCQKRGSTHEARGYCQQCCEYLCGRCYEYHGVQKATEKHMLFNNSSMTQSMRNPNVNDILVRRCGVHADKLLEYVCYEHDALCCRACLELNHSACKRRCYIPDVSTKDSNTDKNKGLQADIKNLKTTTTGYYTMLSAAVKYNELYQSNALKRLKEIRQNIDDIVNKVEKKSERLIIKCGKENGDKVTEASRNCKEILSELEHLSSSLDLKTQAGLTNQLFVDVHMSSQRVSELNDKAQAMSHFTISKYEFNDEKLYGLESTLSVLMSLSIKQDGTVTKGAYLHNIDVKNKDDANDCYISGIAVLAKDRVVVTDATNWTVKLIDLTKDRVTSCANLTSQPYDVIETEFGQLAVALGKEYKIELFKVSTSLSSSKVLHIPGAAVKGLCYDGKVLIAACRNPGSVKIINMTGTILKSIDDKTMNGSFVTSPTRIALSRDLTVVYVTDNDANTVTTLNLNGKIISVYRSDVLDSPKGITVGRYGEVFVCCRNRDTIHQLSPTGQNSRIIMEKTHKLPDYPNAIDFRDNVIYISSGSSVPKLRNNLSLFKLE